MKEWIFPDNGPKIGQPGPLTEQKYVAHDQAKIGAYWPYVIYQGLSGEIRSVHYACHEKNECWHESVLDTIETKNGTQLVVLPLAHNSSLMGLFYQEEEEDRFLAYTQDKSGKGESWENGKPHWYICRPVPTVLTLASGFLASHTFRCIRGFILYNAIR